MKCVRWSPEWKEKVFTEDRARKISETLKKKYACGERKNWTVGKKLTEEHKRKIKENAPKGTNNHAWKGNKVGYVGLHYWVRKYLPKPHLCPKCSQERRLEASNISGEYLRDLTDWEWLCRSCHIKKDMWSDESWRGKISKALTGKKQSYETIEKRRIALLGHHCSEETRRKISIAHKGKQWSKGMHWSEEHKRKIGDANRISVKKYWDMKRKHLLEG